MTRPSSTRPRAFRRVLFFAGGVLSLTGLAIWLGWGRGQAVSGDSATGELIYKVTRGPLTISFTERGSVKALRSEQIISRLEGTSTIVQVVPEGTFVKKEDLLVEMDSSELTQLYNQQQIAVETSRAALVQADEGVEIQKLANQGELGAAQLAVDLAHIDVTKYEEGDWPLARAKARADIYIAEEEEKRAQNRHDWTKKLAQKGYVTGTELLADDLAVKKAKVQLDQAKGALNVLEQYTRRKEAKKVASDLEQANLSLERAKLKARSQSAQALADQKAKKATYELSLRRLNKIKDQIDKTRILAPQDGMVVYKQEGRGREDRIIEQGATVRENQHLIDLPDLSTMAVTVQVPEARIHQVRRGLNATSSIEAQTEILFRGKVSKIALLPDYVNRWLNPDLKTYLTEITIDSDQDISFLRPGMTAKVEILVEELSDTLFVPVQSVTTIDGAPVCYLIKEGKFAPRSVELGESNDSFVVVRAGLEEGDLVQLNAPRAQGMPPERRDQDKDREKERERKGKEKDLESGPEVLPTSYQEDEGSRPKRKRHKKEEKTAASVPPSPGPGMPPKNVAGSP